MTFRVLGPACLALMMGSLAFAADGPALDAEGFAKLVQPYLAKHCTACHGAKKPEGNLSLDKIRLAEFASGDAAQTWAEILERLATGNMPPEDEPRPDRHDTNRVILWIRDQLLIVGHGAEFNFPEKGNHVPHEVLFGGKTQATPSTPARVWRISPYQYDGLFGTLIGQGRRSIEGPKGLPLPFGLRGGPGLQDYSNLYQLDQAQVELLLLNARTIAQQLVDPGGKGENRVFRSFGATTEPPTDADISSLVTEMCMHILKRAPRAEERERYETFLRRDVERFGNRVGMQNALMVVMLHPEAVFRLELADGEPDEHGRVLLAPRALANAIAAAFSDGPPDKQLLKALNNGGLTTREEVRAHAERYAALPAQSNPRLLRFFQEYFGYPACIEVFKDRNAITDEQRYELLNDTNRLILYILDEDQHVLERLLTTNESFVAVNSGRKLREQVAKRGSAPATPFSFRNRINELYNLEPEKWSLDQPLQLNPAERSGILTQPSWLLAHSSNDANDAIHRGKWIRERLLGGAIPDTPITVQAQLPEEPESTLRERMRVTREEYCWKCHQRMDPLGLSLEMFDDWGRHRTTELERPVDTSGAIWQSPDPQLNGPVSNGIELLKKLSKSEYVQQVFVRHAFRYWLGRNETAEDAPTLQAAYEAYRSQGGSMKALVVSLVTSDSFVYRKK